MEEAINNVRYAKSHPEKAQIIADTAFRKVYAEHHTYTYRVETILKECGLWKDEYESCRNGAYT